ncbi:MAG: SRPBCC family protein [Acidimicrobiales bacterium]
MRHELQTQVEIEATPETVWNVLTDLDHYAEWNPFIVEASGVVAIGNELTNRMQPPGGKAMTIKPAVTALEPVQTFEWLGHLGFRGVFDGRHRFELRPTATGGTRVLHTEQFQGVLVRFMRKTLDTQTHDGFEAMNAALKVRAEAQAGTAS